MEFIRQHAEEKRQHERNRERNRDAFSVSGEVVGESFGVEHRVSADRDEGFPRHHKKEEDQEIIRFAVALDEIGLEIGEKALALARGRGRVFAFLDQEAQHRETDAVEETDPDEEYRIVIARGLKQPPVENDPDRQTDHPEKAVKAPHHLARHHVVDESGEYRVGRDHPEFKERPEKAQQHQRRVLNPQRFELEPLPDLVAVGQSQHPGNHDRGGDKEVGDAAAEAAAETVGVETDDRHQPEPDRRRDRGDQNAVDEVGSAMFLKNQPRHRRDRAFAERPDHIADQQHGEDESQAAEGVGQSPHFPAFGSAVVIETPGVGIDGMENFFDAHIVPFG